jgi:hypothetical protein
LPVETIQVHLDSLLAGIEEGDPSRKGYTGPDLAVTFEEERARTRAATHGTPIA